MLDALAAIRSPSHVYRPLVVEYVGEEAQDQNGVTIDLLAQFFRSLRASFPGMLQQKGQRVLAVADAAMPSPPTQGGSDDGQIPIPAATADPPPKRQRRGGGGEGSSSRRSDDDGVCEWLPSVGERVDCDWHGEGRWFAGRVDMAEGEGVFAVKFDDGDYEGHVPASRLRCRVTSGSFFPAAQAAAASGSTSQGWPAGRSVGCRSWEEQLALVGRLLALSLALGDGYFVDDLLPDYVIEVHRHTHGQHLLPLPPLPSQAPTAATAVT